MERHFDEELASLKEDLLRMGAMVEESIARAMEALSGLNSEEALHIIEDDKKIDAIELFIDERCLDLLALRQPLAVDLRFITMVMKITTDLERMADLAVDIAQRVCELADKPMLKPLVDIPKLSILAREMVRDALDSFLTRNTSLARDVIKKDVEADHLRDLVQTELIHDYMVKDARTAPRAVSLLLVARHLERICDHATNIAEDVIYMISAKVVKHHQEALDNGI